MFYIQKTKSFSFLHSKPKYLTFYFLTQKNISRSMFLIISKKNWCSDSKTTEFCALESKPGKNVSSYLRF